MRKYYLLRTIGNVENPAEALCLHSFLSIGRSVSLQVVHEDTDLLIWVGGFKFIEPLAKFRDINGLREELPMLESIFFRDRC